MEITRTDPTTGKQNTLDLNITDKQLEDWMFGTAVQIAMPNLTVDEREFVKTGILPENFDKIFKENLKEDELTKEDIMSDYELATASFKANGVLYEFEVVSNLQKFNLKLVDALHSWIARVKTYEIESFCAYVMSKDPGIICVTKEYYDSLPDDVD